MIEVELHYDATTAVELEADFAATSGTLSVRKPDDTELSAPSVTVSSISTTIDSGTTKTALALVSITGITVGTKLLVTSDGVTYKCEVAAIETSTKTVTLRTGLPAIPDIGAVVKGALLTASVAAAGAANVGPNYRLRWTYTDGVTSKTVNVAASVVRQLWTPPVVAEDVRDVLAEMSITHRSEQWCAEVASRVDEMIRSKVLATGRRPWAFLAAESFRPAARLGIRFELAQRGIAHGGQIYEAQREHRFAFEDMLSRAIGSISYDSNFDGKIGGDEATPNHYTIQAVR